MAAATWKGSIAFGPMLLIPVKARGAVKETTFPFNQHHSPELCPAGGGRIGTGSQMCKGCNAQVEKDDIVRGYGGVPGIDEDYLTQLEQSKSGAVELVALVPAEQIDPRMFAKSYDLIADNGAGKGYVLLRSILEQAGRVAVGKVVMSKTESIVAIRARDGVLAMELLYWPEEVDATGSRDEAAKSIDKVVVTDAEVQMGLQLAKFMSADFDASLFKNEWAAAMGEYLALHVQGEKPVAITSAPRAEKPTGDLMAALEASMAAMAGAQPAAKKEKVKVA